MCICMCIPVEVYVRVCVCVCMCMCAFEGGRNVNGFSRMSAQSGESI
jgi:hypothetical protein